MNKWNYLQHMRKANITEVQKKIAVSMPVGVEDRKLRAVLMYELGVTKKKLDEYLEILTDARVIELIPDKVNPNKGMWKIVFAENQENNKKLKLPSQSKKES